MLKFDSVDAGHGLADFALPPAELALHPSGRTTSTRSSSCAMTCTAFMAQMKEKRVTCSPVDEQRWGSITRLTLPGGGKLGVYQPKHPSPLKPTALEID